MSDVFMMTLARVSEEEVCEDEVAVRGRGCKLGEESVQGEE